MKKSIYLTDLNNTGSPMLAAVNMMNMAMKKKTMKSGTRGQDGPEHVPSAASTTLLSESTMQLQFMYSCTKLK